MYSTLRPFTLGVLCGLSAISGCAWHTPDDYADSEAFVAYAIPAVLGRRPYSHQEVQALARLADHAGEEAVLGVLFEQPDFAEHWSAVFTSILEVTWGQPDGGACYQEPMVPEVFYPALVDHVATAPVQEPFCLSLSVAEAQYDQLVSAYGKDRVWTWIKDATGKEEAVDLTPSSVGVKDLYVDYGALKGPYGELVSRQASEDGKVSGKGAEIAPISRAGEELVPPLDEVVIKEFDLTPGLPESVQGELCLPYNMADLLHASVQEDRLDALYRGFLVSMSMLEQRRSRMPSSAGARKFYDVFLDRDANCMQCHDSNYSTTDATPRNDMWDRFAPPPGMALEVDAFSYVKDGQFMHRPLSGGYANVAAFWAAENFVDSDTAGLRPLGFDPVCVTQEVFNPSEESPVIRSYAPSPPSADAAAFGFSPDEPAGVLQLADRLAEGIAAMPYDSYSPAPNTVGGNAEIGAQVYAGCEGCHNSAHDRAPPDLIQHVAQMTPERIYSITRYGTPSGMPSYSDQDAKNVTAFLISQPEYRTPMVYDTDGAALSQLVAQSVVIDVVEELSGARLVEDHGFPRNDDAALALAALSFELQRTDWSLKQLLYQILSSDHINRRAPAESDEAAYVLPQVVNTGSMTPPSTELLLPGANANGQGDLVNRWSSDSLIRQVGVAMQWEVDLAYSDDASSSEYLLRTDLGGYVNGSRNTFREPYVDMLVAWEDTHGSCPDEPGDYINTLMESDLTLEEAMLAVKDRLVSNPTWDPGLGDDSELRFTALLTRGGDLSAMAYTDEAAVRDYCSALLRSPQFLLAGLPAWPEGVDPEPLRGLPCVDALCSEDDFCEAYRDTADRLGFLSGFDCPFEE